MNTFTNQATLNLNGTVITSNKVRGFVLDKVTVSKAVVKNTYQKVGDSIVYTIGINNKTNTDITNVIFKDNLGEYVYTTDIKVVPLTYSDGTLKFFENGILQPKREPTIADDGTIVLDDITVPANGNVVISYETIVNSYAQLNAGGYIKNKAEFTGTNDVEAEAEAIIYAEVSPDLRIQKELYPTILDDSEEQVTYRFVIENYGNMEVTPFSGLILSDTFNPALKIEQVTIGDRTATEDVDYTYEDGEFNTIAGKIVVGKASYQRDATGKVTVTPARTYVAISGKLINP